ncbi:hypothetical protein NLU13_9847 [Sarocladium strictum]|uniref:Uncharacterized protein n=1 Tax=Sarocladium strictum TaxID=5046 RepID=A0AA39G958_SARSR|nr:hypothetical protein NLU13_9847 [Sarocladium strictum]
MAPAHSFFSWTRRDTGDAGSAQAPGVGTGTDAGASGDSSANSVDLSTGGLVAIIVVVVAVVILGVTTAALFWIAKQREWTIKETIRRSAKKVATALTPRRSEFPAHLKDTDSTASLKVSKKSRGRQGNDVPPTPRLRPEDVEKGLAQAEARSKGRM